jgi:hypothetical protein
VPFGFGRKVLQAAQGVNEDYVMPVAREAGKQLFNSSGPNVPMENRPMRYYDFLPQDQRSQYYPNAPVDTPPSPAPPKVPGDWYKRYGQR